MLQNQNKFIFIILVFFQNHLFAADLMYVQAASAKLKSGPSMSAPDIATLNRGTIVFPGQAQGVWVEVTANNKKGWISKLFISKTKPIGEAELMKNPSETDSKVSRKRSSDFAVSAATRGLQANDRVRDGRELYRSNNQAVDNLDKMNIPDQQLKKFEDAGKLNP